MEEFLNVKGAAAFLKCTEQTVRRYVMAKKIPYHKIDRMVRFCPAELREWVINGKAAKIAGKKKDRIALFAETETAETDREEAGND